MNKIRKIVLGALFVALDIIFTRFMYTYLPSVATPIVRISPQFLAHAMSGWILGPWYAILTALAGDLLGMLTNPAGMQFLPGYSLSAMLGGLAYGLFLYKKPVRIWRCFLSVSSVVVFISLFLGSFWFVLYRSETKTFSVFLTTLLTALPWRVISIAIYVPVLFLVQKGLVRARVLDRAWIE